MRCSVWQELRDRGTDLFLWCSHQPSGLQMGQESWLVLVCTLLTELVVFLFFFYSVVPWLRPSETSGV